MMQFRRPAPPAVTRCGQGAPADNSSLIWVEICSVGVCALLALGRRESGLAAARRRPGGGPARGVTAEGGQTAGKL